MPVQGNELKRVPRSPKQAIFNALMIECITVSALIIGAIAFYVFQYLLSMKMSVNEARNHTLRLMVLFENLHVFNCRSETRSTFLHNPLRRCLLLFATLAAQLILILAMYTPWIKDALHIQPVSFTQWLPLLSYALIILMVMELQKVLRKHFPFKVTSR